MMHVILLLIAFLQGYAFAAPMDPGVTPQVEISGVGIGTLGYGKTAAHPEGQATVDFSESAILLGASERLYNGAVGSLAIGALTTDTVNRAVPLFIQQAFVDYQSQTLEVLVGRSDHPAARALDFPTLRSD